jgi:meprin A
MDLTIGHNFAKTEDHNANHLGTAYDFYSIMHYKWNAFAINNTMPTIKIKNNRIDYKVLGTNGNLSSVDIIEINKLYKCPVKGNFR